MSYGPGVPYANIPMHRLPNQLQIVAEIQHFQNFGSPISAQTRSEKYDFCSKIWWPDLEIFEIFENLEIFEIFVLKIFYLVFMPGSVYSNDEKT